MVATAELIIFLAGAAVSLGASYVLVTRLERIGERLGLSEGLLGVLAALAGDAPEITSAVTALATHQNKVGAGVVIGSNVFNLAALLGLGAVVAGRIALHRNVILLGGVVGIWLAVVCLVTVLGLITAGVALVAALAALIPYLLVLGASRARLAGIPLARVTQATARAATPAGPRPIPPRLPSIPPSHPGRSGRLPAAVTAA